MVPRVPPHRASGTLLHPSLRSMIAYTQLKDHRIQRTLTLYPRRTRQCHTPHRRPSLHLYKHTNMLRRRSIRKGTSPVRECSAMTVVCNELEWSTFLHMTAQTTDIISAYLPRKRHRTLFIQSLLVRLPTTQRRKSYPASTLIRLVVNRSHLRPMEEVHSDRLSQDHTPSKSMLIPTNTYLGLAQFHHQFHLRMTGNVA